MTEVWEIKRVELGAEQEWLRQGWEPFAVTTSDVSYHEEREIIYLRRKVPTA